MNMIAAAKRYYKWLLLLVIVTGFILIIAYGTDTEFKDIVAAWRQAGWAAMLAVVAVMLTQVLIQAFSWQVLLYGCGYRLRFALACQAVFVAWAANFVTPSMYLGGEPVRALLITHEAGISFGKALASVVVHKFLEFAAFMVLIIASSILICYRFRQLLSRHLQSSLLLGVGLMIFVFVTILVSLLWKKRLLEASAHLAMRWRIFPCLLQRALPKIIEFEDTLLDAFHKNPRFTMLSLLLMVLFEALVFIRPLAFFIFIGRSLPMGELALLFLMIQLILAMQFTPGGVGIFEGGIVATLALIHISPAHAIGFASFCRLGDLVLVGIGLVFAVLNGLKLFSRSPQ